jgi:hypothetical protein
MTQRRRRKEEKLAGVIDNRRCNQEHIKCHETTSGQERGKTATKMNMEEVSQRVDTGLR